MKRKHTFWMVVAAAATMVIGATLIEPMAGGVVTVDPPLVDRTGPSPELAASIRACEIDKAEDLLSGTDSVSPADRSTILGLTSQRCERFSESLETLRNGDAGGDLGDWRLYAIATGSIELGQFPAAKAALEQLRSDYPESPLRGKAELVASELARLRGDLQGVLEISRQGTPWPLDRETSEALAIDSWNAAIELGDFDARTEAAKRLLVQHPLKAAELKVIEDFRAEDGSVEWADFLEAPDLIQRASSLMRVDLEESAITMLESVPSEARSTNWHLTMAEALIATKRGDEALAVLDEATWSTALEESEIEWNRSAAAFEASRPRAGRQLNSVQRKLMRERAHSHLARVVDLGVDLDRSKKALRIMFEDALEEDRFEDSLDALRRLQELDPADTSGARQLWTFGWKEYSERNYSGAVGYWSELSTLYPTSSYNRSGLYWSARAHELLGNAARSQQLLVEVADVPFTDFYRRHALKRLEEPVSETAGAGTPSEPWPRDPVLFRSEMLTAFGLDETAKVELEALEDQADSRASRALKARILANRGEARKSIIEIKRAFSLLGTPFQGMAPERARRIYYPLAYDEIIDRYAEANGLETNLVFAMIRQESAFDAGARSWAGARGLMQVMPPTGKEIARRLGLRYSRDKLSDPAFSVQLGTTYYRQVRTMFGNDDELALAGYNAGPYRIKRLWKKAGAGAEVDRFLESLYLAETRTYVKRVLLFADSYQRLYPELG